MENHCHTRSLPPLLTSGGHYGRASIMVSSCNILCETEKELREFCCLCQYIYEQWITYYCLFEEMPNRLESKSYMPFEEFLETPYGSCLYRLQKAMHCHCILEVAKLHDTVDQRGHVNLSIYHIAAQKLWSEEEKNR